MDYKKLSKQDYFFVNCNTTYFQTALSYYVNEHKNDLLLYLADCELLYTNKFDGGAVIGEQNSTEYESDDPVIYDKDPFYQQPIRLYTNDKKILFNNKSFFELLKFLKNSLNIKVNIIFSPLTKEQLTARLQKAFSNNELYIINVDSYWCPYHPLLYKRIHSRHGLLVKALNIEANTVEVIDTNWLKPYTLDFDDVLAGLNTDHFINMIVKINGNNFDCQIDYRERLHTFLKNVSPITFIENIYSNLGHYLHADSVSEEDKNFHSKRYVLAIKFQLLPYLKMRHHLFSINSIIHSAQDMEQSIQLWTLLSDILLALRHNKGDIPCELLNIGDCNKDSIYKLEDYNEDCIFEMLDRLSVMEDKIYTSIKKIEYQNVN